MSLKAQFLLITLLVGTNAFPASKQDKDMTIFFDHADAEARIVGGIDADDVPYTVSLSAGLFVRDLVCGGSLVTNRHVLTAAHCIQAVFARGGLLGSLRGIVGSNRWNIGTQYSFSYNLTHPNYIYTMIKNDIGFLVTKVNVEMSKTVQPVTLNYDYIDAGVAATITGFGRIIAGGPLSENLMQLSTTVVDGDRCAAQFKIIEELFDLGYPAVEPHIEICTFNATGRGTCNGDSGSPLMRTDLNQQIGVVSWGMACARGVPDVYARLSAFRAWIEQILRAL